jgi:tetratricopeptide (TPR) repeat protein
MKTRKGVRQPSDGLLVKLLRIGEIKSSLPFDQRGWCNELGLFVQLRQANEILRLEAGGKFRARIRVQREGPNEPWRIVKYQAGAWEDLVQPTLELAEWLGDREGFPGLVKDDFDRAVKAFRAGSSLVLPRSAGSVLEGIGKLGQLLEQGDSKNNIETLLRFVSTYPSDATAWDCLARSYEEEGRFREATLACKQALQFAPHDPQIHAFMALLYEAALQNAIKDISSRLALKSPNPSIPPGGFIRKGHETCTIESLGCTWEEARHGAIHHLEIVVVSPMLSNKDKVTISIKLSRFKSLIEHLPQKAADQQAHRNEMDDG